MSEEETLAERIIRESEETMHKEKAEIARLANDFFVGDDHVDLSPLKRPRKSRAWPKDLLALRRFCKTINAVDENARRAAICWLADAYLGIKLWRNC